MQQKTSTKDAKRSAKKKDRETETERQRETEREEAAGTRQHEADAKKLSRQNSGTESIAQLVLATPSYSPLLPARVST